MRRVLEVFSEGRYLTVQQLAAECSCSPSTARRRLRDLASRGRGTGSLIFQGRNGALFAEVIPRGLDGYARKYRPAPEKLTPSERAILQPQRSREDRGPVGCS